MNYSFARENLVRGLVWWWGAVSRIGLCPLVLATLIRNFQIQEIVPGITGISVAGDVETTSLTANVGVTVPLNQKLSFEASFWLGLYISKSFPRNGAGSKSLDVLSDSGFSYELSSSS